MPPSSSDVEEYEKLRKELDGIFNSVRPRDSREAAQEAIIRSVLEAAKLDEALRRQLIDTINHKISDLTSRVIRLERAPKGPGYSSKPIQMPNRELGETILKGIMDTARGIELSAEVVGSLAALGLRSRGEVTRYFDELREVVVERFEGYVTERIKTEEERIMKKRAVRSTLFTLIGIPAIIVASIFGNQVWNYFKAQRMRTEGISGQVVALEARTKEIAVLQEAYLDLNLKFGELASNQYAQAQTISNLTAQVDASERDTKNYVDETACELESENHTRDVDLERRVNERIDLSHSNLTSRIQESVASLVGRIDKHAEVLQKDGNSIASLSHEISVLTQLIQDNSSEDKRAYSSVVNFIKLVEDRVEAYGASGKLTQKELDLMKKQLDDLRKASDDYLLKIPSLRFGSD
ncbi:hypothetical protein FJZ17_01640 [Candidatus Pacearchaeota archaeon]|nr:hypothetical protein [Candidatus Pacearchaeota archaeon]